MSLFCSPPFWTDGRISGCAQNNYLSNLIPLGTSLVSLVLLSLAHIHHLRQNKHSVYGFERVAAMDEEGVASQAAAAYQQSISTNVTMIVPRMAVLETLMLLADISLGLGLVIYARTAYEQPGPLALIVFSLYLLLLVAARNWIAARSPKMYSCLQLHSTLLYAVQWLCTIVVVHSLLVDHHGTGGLWRTAIFVRFAFFTALTLIHLTAPIRPLHGISQFVSKPGKDEAASLISRLTYSWVDGLVWKAFRGTLEASDLYQLNRDQTSAVVVPGFFSAAAATLPLLWRLYHFFKCDLLKQGIWAAVMSFAVFIPAMLIRLILAYLESPAMMTHSTAWICVGGLLVSGLLTGIAECQCEWIGRKISAKLRTILISDIYAKVLRKRLARPPTASEHDLNKETSTGSHASDGNILNLMSADAEFISEISANLHFTWVSFPVQTTIATYLLYKLLGPSGVIGVLLMVALLPLNILVSKRLAAVQEHVLVASDTRVQSSNELLHNIRTIKYLAWEAPFRERVLEKRREELQRMRSRFIWWSISMTLFHSLPFIVTILTCFFYTVVWGNDLGTSTAFPALALFAVLRIPLNRMADAISFLLQAHVSVLRVDKFLKERETDKYTQLASSSNSSTIGFDDATLTWPTSGVASTAGVGEIRLTDMPSAQPFQLQDIEIKFQENALNIICGPSGAGKSSLLLALLGEMELISGQVFLPHEPRGGLASNFYGLHNGSDILSTTTAYCPQEPWILNQTIRANILFGLAFNSHRYNMVLHAVALHQDLTALDKGDNTLAGENGNRLSGGQKQRVALARALYSLAKYVLLDDCLSAVDSRSANHIFFHALKGPIMQNRTCILATHHIQLTVPHCDYVVLLDSGRVKSKGTAEDLVSAGFLAADLIQGKVEASSPTASLNLESNGHPMSHLLAKGTSSSLSLETEVLDDYDRPQESDSKPNYTESKSEGSIAWTVVQSYLVAMGARWYWAIVLLGFAAQQLVALGTNLWVKEWAYQYDNQAKKEASITTPLENEMSKSEKVDAGYYLTIYAILCLLFALITFCRDAITFTGALKASSQIYERLLNSILFAKLIFFDQVPLGQITNRFQTDVSVVDQSLAPFSISAFQIMSSIAVVLILISIVMPAFLFVAAIVCLAYYLVMTVYIDSSRDLKRIEAVERSPLYQQFGETLSGCVSIRAYSRVPMFTTQNHTLIDRFNQPYIMLWATKEWLTFRIGFLGSLISFMTGAFAVWNQGLINSGAAGLVLTYAVTLTEQVIWFVQIYAIVQQDFNSVDRIFEYTQVDQEAVTPPRRAVYDLPHDWPSRGHVRFESYTTRYAPDLDPVLKDVSFEVAAGKRIGIVGRTGAGKSTLTLALIRGLEADNGHITIDGIDIASVTLERLRQVVTVVPQDPTLFAGSLRENLDPLHLYTDNEMLRLLRTVRLVDPTDLDESHLDRAADALSRGQRQLLCIARALIRRSRVLVLDEATASVDHAADALIQAGLRASVAAGTTVLTIAHRLQTIADYDSIVVLDSGRVVEQGKVSDLLGRRGEGAVFRRLCEESGDIEAIEKSARGVTGNLK